ncbi:histidinol dehydrogenase [Candidatus Sumerlaeota bacterium]|nr:histidinol dehydrogenase [Candidatus Sumerlaeota bacterium]
MTVPVLPYPKEKKKIVERLTPVFCTSDAKTEEDVRKIISRVRRDGDKALIHFSRKFDHHPVTLTKALALDEAYLREAWDQLPPDLSQSLRRARARITRFHEQQRVRGFRLTEPSGNRMSQQIFPLRSVGVYVPGGAASYPSTVLMNVIPAKVAGVPEIVMVTPPSGPALGHRAVLGAAHLCGVKTVYLSGGAQAVAAMAYGTETIPRVDKIVGPGNRWVATAKRLLYGEIDIDSVAGPSEVLIVADHTAKMEMVAADMLAQAEHDPDAAAIVILVGSRAKVEPLQRAIAEQTRGAQRREIIQKSLKKNGLIIRVKTIEEAIELANLRAPEHCEVITENAREVAAQIRDAGALFIGPWTPEAVGDYVAGPNHVLPTARTARFFSPLGVEDFIKRNHVIECTQRGLMALAPTVRTLASAEGLDAHRAAVDIRMNARESKSPEERPAGEPKRKPARRASKRA